MTRSSAATFSFLLAIPAIGGASLLELRDLATSGEPMATSPLALALGFMLAFAVGLAALSWLIRWLERGRLHDFAWWCIPVGLGVVAWQLIVEAG